MILLDTHALIWFTQGEERLGPNARSIIHQAFDEGEAAASAMSFWEAAMLASKERLLLGQPVARWLAGLRGGGVEIISITPEIGIAAGELPAGIHGDPSDRMIIATARMLECPVVTADRKILRYAEEGHVRVIDARD